MSEANVRLSIDTAALNAAVGHFLSRAAAEYRGTLFAAARQNVPVRTGASPAGGSAYPSGNASRQSRSASPTATMPTSATLVSQPARASVVGPRK